MRIIYWLEHIPKQEDIWSQIELAKKIWKDTNNILKIRSSYWDRLQNNLPGAVVLHRFCTQNQQLKPDNVQIDKEDSSDHFTLWHPMARIEVVSQTFVCGCAIVELNTLCKICCRHFNIQ